jgi:hypothetical protein
LIKRFYICRWRARGTIYRRIIVICVEKIAYTPDMGKW